jgi:hypothetical protein
MKFVEFTMDADDAKLLVRPDKIDAIQPVKFGHNTEHYTRATILDVGGIHYQVRETIEEVQRILDNAHYEYLAKQIGGTDG